MWLIIGQNINIGNLPLCFGAHCTLGKFVSKIIKTTDVHEQNALFKKKQQNQNGF